MYYGRQYKAPNYAQLVAQYNKKMINNGHPELIIFFNNDDNIDILIDHKWNEWKERISSHYNSKDYYCMYDPRNHQIVSGKTVKEMYDFIGAEYFGEPF